MKLNDYASVRKTKGYYVVPKSAQHSIPVEEIFADGMWRSGDVYCRMLRISDINFAMLSDDKKREICTLYGVVYAGIPTDCWAKFCIISQKMDEKSFRRDILYQLTNDGHDNFRTEINQYLSSCIQDVGNVIQQKYIIVSTSKPDRRTAQARLRQVESHLISSFTALGSTVTAVSINEWLEILHNFFRIGEEGRFTFDINEAQKLGQDFRDAVCPDTISFKKDHIEIDQRFAKCMSITQYPQMLDDRFITTLLQQVPYIVLSIDVVPVDSEDAQKAVDDARMTVDAEKLRFNRKSVENLDFTSSIPHAVQTQEIAVEKFQTDLSDRDQQMFLTLLTVATFANTQEELEQAIDALKTAAVHYHCRFTDLNYQQENAFNTAMPFGIRRIENMRTMVTSNVTALVPFNTQEVVIPGGIYYGVNAMSGNLIVGLRSKLVNGNSMVIATSGAGKSLFVKQEVIELYLKFPKAKFYIIDPENEYRPLVEALGGVIVDISVDSDTHFNPMDFTFETPKRLPHMAKVEFILSLCEQIMGKDNVQPGDRTLVDRSLRNVYDPLVKSNYQEPCPTLTDLWHELLALGHERADEIALALEIFATGSLSMFSKPTNIDMSNRLVCFNIQSLGDQLKPVAMLSMLEYINTSVISGNRNDPQAATWVYIDEIYLLLKNKISADFLFESWKRFRKYNSFVTGITQNVEDCLSNTAAYTMLSNSEFTCMLRQTKDIDSIVKLYGLSEPQRNYLLLARPGQGILKMGNSLIPFVNDYPKDTQTYSLFTTKPGEMKQ